MDIRQQIRQAVRIEAMISEHITLTRKGQSLVGTHHTHTSNSGTSFAVDPEQQLYHCFNCSEGGDIFSWVMNTFNYNFPQALKYLAQKSGVPMPDWTPEQKQNYERLWDEKQQLSKLYLDTAKFYHEQMTSEIYDICQQLWGLREDTVKKFLIGFAPDYGDELKKHLLTQGYKSILLAKSGLFVMMQDGLKDFFQGRIIFPYWTTLHIDGGSGTPEYFIGRQTRYTPNTDWEKGKYKKLLVHNEKHSYVSENVSNEHFFGEHSLRQARDGCLIVTEGVADCLAVLQVGIPCISPVTTSFREADWGRLAQLCKIAKQVIIINDNEDNGSGKRGALKTAQHLQEQGIDVRIGELPRDGQDKIDLADYLKTHSVDDLKKITKSAKTLVNYYINLVVEADEQDKVNSAAAAYDLISKLTGVEREQAEKQLQKVLKVSIRVVRQALLERADNKKETIKEIIPGMPEGLIIPKAWSFTRSGIWQETNFGSSCACAVPVILTKRLYNIDTSDEKIELAFYRDQHWKHMSVERAMVFNRANVIQLANKGLPISSESAKSFVKYLSDFERENLDTLGIAQSTNHMGWCGDNKFLPGAAEGIVIDVDDGTASNNGYQEKGTLEEWIQYAKQVRQYPIARFMLAASFSTPFMRIIKQRNSILHIFGPSRAGKTAGAKVLLSVWGDPEILMANFNATKVGIERLASFHSDLPLSVDEKQVVGDKQGFIEALVYLLGLGKGKTRGTKTGGLQNTAIWRCLAITTGEEPITTESSRGGIGTRTLEIYAKEVLAEPASGQAHNWTKDKHGTAGVFFINKILEIYKQDKEYFANDFTAIQSKLNTKHDAKIKDHLSLISMIAMADFYVSQWIFGIDEKTAYAEALEMAETIIAEIPNQNDLDDATRAFDYLKSWFNVNKDFFDEHPPQGRRYGKVDINLNFQTGDLYIYPIIFEMAMKEGGFNSSRILRDWADKEWIKTEIKGGKRRLKIGKHEEGREINYVCVQILKKSDPFSPESDPSDPLSDPLKS